MSNLFTVDVQNANTQLKPVTVAQFKDDLANDMTKVYVYVGQEGDPGWEKALLAAGALPNLNPYLATDIEVLRPWVPAGTPSGVVFGSDDNPDRFLDAAEAAVSKIVLNANANAS